MTNTISLVNFFKNITNVDVNNNIMFYDLIKQLNIYDISKNNMIDFIEEYNPYIDIGISDINDEKLNYPKNRVDHYLLIYKLISLQIVINRKIIQEIHNLENIDAYSFETNFYFPIDEKKSIPLFPINNHNKSDKKSKHIEKPDFVYNIKCKYNNDLCNFKIGYCNNDNYGESIFYSSENNFMLPRFTVYTNILLFFPDLQPGDIVNINFMSVYFDPKNYKYMPLLSNGYIYGEKYYYHRGCVLPNGLILL